MNFFCLLFVCLANTQHWEAGVGSGYHFRMRMLLLACFYARLDTRRDFVSFRHLLSWGFIFRPLFNCFPTMLYTHLHFMIVLIRESLRDASYILITTYIIY